MPPASGSRSFEEYASVRLVRPVVTRKRTYPAGTAGVVVHRHDDRIGYDIEPEGSFDVFLLFGDDLVDSE